MASIRVVALSTVLIAAGLAPARSRGAPRNYHPRPPPGPTEAQKRCPLYPAHQIFKEPQATSDTHVTLAVDVVELCSPVSGRRWMTRAYACTSCPDKNPAIPGPTIYTDPGADLYITHVNNLKGPDYTPHEVEEYFAAHPDPALADQRAHVENIGNVNTTSLHPHGLHTSPENEHQEEGFVYLPDTVFTYIRPGETKKYKFPIRKDHMPGTHMYHPHAHHSASCQAGGGMHGALIVKDQPGTLPKFIEDMPTKVCVISLLDLRGFYDKDMKAQGSIGGGYYFDGSFAGMGMLEQQGRGDLWKNLEGPDKGQYVEEKSIFALVNGMYRPRMTGLITGHWYRFKFVFASVEMFIQAVVDSNTGLHCEMQLLAKDGIWLHVAPRDIAAIYLASGNRADVAMRCECTWGRNTCDGGLYAVNTDATIEGAVLSDKQKKLDANIDPAKGLHTDLLVQELLFFEFTRPSTGRPQEDMKPFVVTRPCYLADLRPVVVPPDHYGRIDFWAPMDGDETTGWKVTYTDWYTYFKGAQMDHMDAPPVFELTNGEVYQFLVRGPLVKKGGVAEHPFHMHTIPYQINSLVTMDKYFLVGDWHDTFMHAAGQVVVKAHTDSYIGRYIIHCHILTHHDYGMMTYFNVTGKEGAIWEGAEKVDPTCFRAHNVNPGYKWASETDQLENQLPDKPHWRVGNPGESCHSVCVDFGGCNGMGWPKSLEEFNRTVLTWTALGVCTFQMIPTKYKFNPSIRYTKRVGGNQMILDKKTGVCQWEFDPYFSSSTVPDGNYRCGATPAPAYEMARFCPCNKAAGTQGLTII